MLFVSRIYKLIKVASVVLLALLGIATGLFLLYPQNRGTFWNSFHLWVLGIPIGLVAWLILEWCGTAVMGLSLWQNMPSAIRVLLLAAIIVFVIVAAVFTMQFAYAF